MRLFNREKPEPLMTSEEAAKYLRVSRDTLYRMVRDGYISPYVLPGDHYRYTQEMLDEYLERSKKFKRGEGGKGAQDAKSQIR